MWPERLVISDVSRMKENRVCIAGINGDGTCIRPILPYVNVKLEHLYENEDLIIAPRHLVEFQVVKAIQRPPHTEDYEYSPNEVRLVKILSQAEMKRVLQESCFESVADIFGEKLIDGKYLKPGTGERSIGTVRARISRLDPVNQRVSFYDAAHVFYAARKITDLSFGLYAEDFLKRHPEDRIQAGRLLTAQLKKSRDIFLRLGLTRPWKNPDGIEGCWLQVTGIHSFPDYLDGKNFAYFQLGSSLHQKEAGAGTAPIEKNKAYDPDEIRRDYSRAYAKWTREDEAVLLEGFRKGLSVGELSVRLGRQPGGIAARLKKLLGNEISLA